jgi:hypothetical protein
MDHRAIDVDGDIVKPTRLTHLGVRQEAGKE